MEWRCHQILDLNWDSILGQIETARHETVRYGSEVPFNRFGADIKHWNLAPQLRKNATRRRL